jgi:hypothetical protein
MPLPTDRAVLRFSHVDVPRSFLESSCVDRAGRPGAVARLRIEFRIFEPIVSLEATAW